MVTVVFPARQGLRLQPPSRATTDGTADPVVVTVWAAGRLLAGPPTRVPVDGRAARELASFSHGLLLRTVVVAVASGCFAAGVVLLVGVTVSWFGAGAVVGLPVLGLLTAAAIAGLLVRGWGAPATAPAGYPTARQGKIRVRVTVPDVAREWLALNPAARMEIVDETPGTSRYR